MLSLTANLVNNVTSNGILLIVSMEINSEGLFLIVPIIKAENITAMYSSVKAKDDDDDDDAQKISNSPGFIESTLLLFKGSRVKVLNLRFMDNI